MMALLYSRVVFRPLLARRALFSPFLPPSRISTGPYHSKLHLIKQKTSSQSTSLYHQSNITSHTHTALFLGDPTHSAALINESSSMHHRPFMIYFLLNFLSPIFYPYRQITPIILFSLVFFSPCFFFGQKFRYPIRGTIP